MKPGVRVLGLCAAFTLLPCLAAEHSVLEFSDTDRHIQFEMAAEALQQGDKRLATELLRELLLLTSGPEAQLYAALLLRADGRVADSNTALAALLEEVKGVPFPPQWAWSDLVDRLAKQRLADRQEAARQELEAILTRHYEALGGTALLRSDRNFVAQGRVRSQGGEALFRLARKRPRLYRLDIATAEGRHIEAFDSQLAWSLEVSPSGVSGWYLGGTTAARILQESYFDDVLLRYKQTGERLHLAGSETIDSGIAYRIEVDGPANYRETRFLDAATLLEVRRLLWRQPGDTPSDVITLTYKTLDGRPLPIRQVVETADGITEYSFERYDFATELDPQAFNFEAVQSREQIRMESRNAESAPPGS